MGRADAVSPMTWDDDARERLVETRRARGHSQGELAAELSRYGLAGITQSTVSAWETGRISRPSNDALEAIRRYQADEPTPANDALARAQDTELPVDAPTDALAQFALEITEPLLSDRQQRLLDVMIDRLARGDLSDRDITLFRDLAVMLRVPGARRRGAP